MFLHVLLNLWLHSALVYWKDICFIQLKKMNIWKLTKKCPAPVFLATMTMTTVMEMKHHGCQLDKVLEKTVRVYCLINCVFFFPMFLWFYFLNMWIIWYMLVQLAGKKALKKTVLREFTNTTSVKRCGGNQRMPNREQLKIEMCV